MPYQNISATLTPVIIDEIVNQTNDSRNKLGFLVNLVLEEKTTMLKMGDKSVAFVDKSLEYANQNPNLIPPYIDINELSKDITLYKNLTTIFKVIKPLCDAIDDTLTALGSEAFTASLSFYSTVKNASKQNVPGAGAIYDDLSKRFPGRATSNSNKPLKPNPEPK